jgi:hypothetical protein
MIPVTFTALTVSNINNGTTTFAVPVAFTANVAQARAVPAAGGGVYDLYGSGVRTVRTPQTRTVRYLASFSTAVLLNGHINTLMVTDIGKRGLLTYTGGDGHSYSQTAALRNVLVRRLTDRDDETKAEVTLEIDEITLVVKI